MGLTLDHLLLSSTACLSRTSTCFCLLGTSIAQGRLDFCVRALGSPYHTTAKSAFALDPVSSSSRVGTRGERCPSSLDSQKDENHWQQLRISSS